MENPGGSSPSIALRTPPRFGVWLAAGTAAATTPARARPMSSDGTRRPFMASSVRVEQTIVPTGCQGRLARSGQVGYAGRAPRDERPSCRQGGQAMRGSGDALGPVRTSRRAWGYRAALALALLLASWPAQAQDYPTRELRAICNFPAGSGADVFVRYFSDKLSALAGKP